MARKIEKLTVLNTEVDLSDKAGKATLTVQFAGGETHFSIHTMQAAELVGKLRSYFAV